MSDHKKLKKHSDIDDDDDHKSSSKKKSRHDAEKRDHKHRDESRERHKKHKKKKRSHSEDERDRKHDSNGKKKEENKEIEKKPPPETPKSDPPPPPTDPPKKDEPKSVKNPAEIAVHSANAWESADLGDEKRNVKFLKLMGAFKHKDAADVAPKHARAASENQKIAQELEKQFNQGLENKLGRSHHLGLGFHSAAGVPPAATRKEPVIGKHTTFDSDDDKKK